MNRLLFLFLTTISLYAGTVYASAPFVVEQNVLYCTNYYGDKKTIHIVGDILDEDTVKNYCSYNETTVDNISLEMQKIHNRDTDKLIDNIIRWLLATASIILLIFIFMLIFILE